jgi:putative two-component system response regulator
LTDLRIAVVDDTPANVILLEQLLARWGYADVVSTTDPFAVVDLCAELCPDLLLLDLAMPGLDGFELLEQLAPQMKGPRPLPIIVLTADVTTESKHRALALGARDYVTKPFDAHEVRLRVGNMLEMRRLQTELTEYSESLERRVSERTNELELARLDVIERLALAGEFRDDDTQEHARRIGELGSRLAAVLHLDAQVVERFRLAGMLHDIGKIGVPDAILMKPGRLTPYERQQMQMHAEIGGRILTGSRCDLLRLAEEIARSHHERWDGTGYPGRLAGEAIPLSGRIVAVADIFDALTHTRPYKEAWSVDAALVEIVGLSGQHFDPRVVDALLALDRSVLARQAAPSRRRAARQSNPVSARAISSASAPMTSPARSSIT